MTAHGPLDSYQYEVHALMSTNLSSRTRTRQKLKPGERFQSISYVELVPGIWHDWRDALREATFLSLCLDVQGS